MKSIGSIVRSVLVASTILLGAGCHTPGKESPLQRFEYEQAQMGVPFRIILYAPNEARAETAVKAAFKRIEELNAIMSDYETDSEVSKLSRSSEEGSPRVPVSQDLWNVLEASQTMAERTGGAFDITIGPCVALWRKARREHEPPNPARLENARGKIGYTSLVLNEKTRSARLLKRGMRLDLGGIAKGYAADEALKTLGSFGLRRALVAASGDLALGDPPPGESGWRVEIIGYDQPQGPPSAITRLANRGIATSGDLFQRVEIDGVRYSHILNPFTCVGMTNHALATVIARNCMTADSLATPCTILDNEAALRLARQYRAEARIVRLENDRPVIATSKGFPRD